jgi:hypothetical protein
MMPVPSDISKQLDTREAVSGLRTLRRHRQRPAAAVPFQSGCIYTALTDFLAPGASGPKRIDRRLARPGGAAGDVKAQDFCGGGGS